jgi:hypothetical protein
MPYAHTASPLKSTAFPALACSVHEMDELKSRKAVFSSLSNCVWARSGLMFDLEYCADRIRPEGVGNVGWKREVFELEAEGRERLTVLIQLLAFFSSMFHPGVSITVQFRHAVSSIVWLVVCAETSTPMSPCAALSLAHGSSDNDDDEEEEEGERLRVMRWCP